MNAAAAYRAVGTGALGAFTRAALVAGRLEGDLTGDQKLASCPRTGHTLARSMRASPYIPFQLLEHR